MASPLYFSGLYPFYPIGNTTAVCLTRDLPPDVPANILLLPCGDPRNILYTVFSERPNRLRGSLDFTCCDYDPGILARNVLLLTMIMDGVAAPTMWNIFFHMYLDIDSRSTLVSQSNKLAAYTSVAVWRSSPYGAVIKMGTDHTFAELRRHWQLYADFYHPSKQHRSRALKKLMDDTLKQEAANAPEDNLTPIRSSGPLFLHSQTSRLFSEQHRRYWETGTTFTDKTKLATSTYPNSTFLYSRAQEGFNVSSNTDPMVPFHHAPLFGNASDRTLTIGDLVNSAQSQFREWCSAFRTATATGKGGTVAVRFLLGDALAVARALQDFSENTSVQAQGLAAPRVAPWTTCTLELNRVEYTDFGAPTCFDIIDTSNVADYLGLLNIFLAAAPLLTDSPSVALYTESFSLHASDPCIEFEATLFASLSVVAVLMDLAPVDALSGFTTRCNMHELLITFIRSKDKDVHQQKFTWKRPSSGDPSAYPNGGPRPPVFFDTHQLSSLLHNIYVAMFRSEDPSQAPTVRRAVEGRCDAATRALLQGIIVCPSREAFTVFLGFIRTSLRISEEQWSDVIGTFLDIRSENQGHFDKLRDSDIHAQLHRYGLYTFPGLDQVCRPQTTAEPGRLSHWPSVPPLIRVFFTVPRTQFSKLERIVVAAKMPNAWMHCAIDIQEQDPHLFQSLDAAYGTLVDTGTAAKPDLSFREDPDGHKSGADLVFSFVVPSRVLTEAPAGTVVVRLLVRSEPNTVPLLIPVLGWAMCVFSACLEDTDCVHLLPEQPLPLRPPMPTTQMARPQDADELVAIGYQLPVRVDLDSARKEIASLIAKLEITNTTVQAAFARGAMPTVSQCSGIGQRKLRLARKSSYIEVAVPIAIPFLEPDGLKLTRFPVVRANASTFPWNIHRVFLDQFPVLDRANINITQLENWYSPHLGSQRSLREHTVSQDPAHSDTLVNIKQTITSIMLHAAGISSKGSPGRVFALQHDVRKDTDTFLFVDKIRYDVAFHTMVLDAFVLVTSQELFPHVSGALPYLVGQGITHVPVYGGEKEMLGWKLLLPALVERCRTTWTHGANCEYFVRAPRRPAVQLREEEGRRGMMKDRVWRMFAPFVTRIALSPLFGVSYVEHILDPQDMLPKKDSAASVAPAAPVYNASASESESVNAGAGTGTIESVTPVATCNKCKKHESGDLKLLKCSRCRTTFYCSGACQKSDWKAHKLRCGN
ncbi:hypothetical protein LXA43DRAFT_1082213 [Ganoderma leucocontextum]|nr:hypothetical protein LXA43DRAFT_1082213 [Ganoderma leucocontextum]